MNYYSHIKKIIKCPECGSIVDEFIVFSRFLSFQCRKCNFEKKYDLMKKQEIDKKVNLSNILKGDQ